MLVVIIIMAALGGLCYVAYNSFTKLKIKEERNGIKSQMVFLKEQWEEADKYRRICGEKVRDPACESCRQSFDAIRNFIMEEQLPDEVQEVLELKSAVDIENMENFFTEMESLREDSFKSCVHIAELGKKYSLDVEALPEEKVHDKYLEIQGDVQSSEKSNRILVRRMKDVHGGIGELVKNQEELDLTLGYLRNMKEQRFRCNLVIHLMEEECVRARNRNWYWLLDDITVMSCNLPIGDRFDIKTGLVFFPYEGEDEATGREIVGVVAAAAAPFEVRETVQSEDEIQKDTRAILQKGRNYRLELGRTGTVFVDVE